VADHAGHGIALGGPGDVAIQAVRVENCGGAGLWCGVGAAPTVRDCTLTTCGEAGVRLEARAAGLFERCDISVGQAPVAVVIGEGAKPTLRRCRIEGAAGAGVVCAAGAAPSLADCEIVGNHEGICVETGAQPSVHGGRIAANVSYGVHIALDGAARCESVAICDNGGDGVRLDGGARLEVHGCRINGQAKADGVHVRQGAAVVIDGGELADNGFAGIIVERDGVATLHAVRVGGNREHGIVVLPGARVDADGCDLSGNRKAAWCFVAWWDWLRQRWWQGNNREK